jgi:hypothetical protein
MMHRMSAELAAACVALLLAQGVRLTEGLSSEERAGIEGRFDFAFNQDHAALLKLAVPVGDGWADWRGPAEELRVQMAWPIDGLHFDVENNAFWAGSWGPRPIVDVQAVDEARRHLLSWPKLVPLFCTGTRQQPRRRLVRPSSPCIRQMSSTTALIFTTICFGSLAAAEVPLRGSLTLWSPGRTWR